jgi:hypothetical protein
MTEALEEEKRLRAEAKVVFSTFGDYAMPAAGVILTDGIEEFAREREAAVAARQEAEDSMAGTWCVPQQPRSTCLFFVCARQQQWSPWQGR